MVITDEIRSACAWVAQQATQVHINVDRIPAYAASLSDPDPLAPPQPPRGTEREQAAALWLTLDAINFGSGWFPTLRKPAGSTGYQTIAAAVQRRFAHSGQWSAVELTQITPTQLGAVLDQDPDHELVGLFCASLQNLGQRLLNGYDGSFTGPVDAAGSSALSLVQTLSEWDCFADASPYAGRTVPFLKRAQITAADLSRAGLADFDDLERLTLFADNLVPHVLRLDGILRFDPDLVARIERGELIGHDTVEEVEIRACAVQAVELIAAQRPGRHGMTAAQLDQLLWNRGQGTAYKTIPRHRSHTTAY